MSSCKETNVDFIFYVIVNTTLLFMHSVKTNLVKLLSP